MRISDWSSDVCSSDLRNHRQHRARRRHPEAEIVEERERDVARADLQGDDIIHQPRDDRHRHEEDHDHAVRGEDLVVMIGGQIALVRPEGDRRSSSEEQTSELQSLMRISYAVSGVKKQITFINTSTPTLENVTT